MWSRRIYLTNALLISIRGDIMGSRILWLIDGGYLYKAQSTIKDFQIDYIKLKEKLETDGQIWRSYYLNSVIHPMSSELESFHRWMQSAPPIGPKIIVRNYSVKKTTLEFAYCDDCEKNVSISCPDCKSKLIKEHQKGVDVGIATLALSNIGNIDELVLSSGDGDLLDAVEHLSLSGKKISLAVFKNGVSPDLQSRADRIYWIDDFSDAVKRGKS
jgi:uncharacterized LabA/DUF88 family protein